MVSDLLRVMVVKTLSHNTLLRNKCLCKRIKLKIINNSRMSHGRLERYKPPMMSLVLSVLKTRVTRLSLTSFIR